MCFSRYKPTGIDRLRQKVNRIEYKLELWLSLDVKFAIATVDLTHLLRYCFNRGNKRYA